jgi:hypothetical protein
VTGRQNQDFTYQAGHGYTLLLLNTKEFSNKPSATNPATVVNEA